jgi:hypothetical protein
MLRTIWRKKDKIKKYKRNKEKKMMRIWMITPMTATVDFLEKTHMELNRMKK